MARSGNEQRYTLEIIKNGNGYRGLLINFKTQLVEYRTEIEKDKESAFYALESMIATFKEKYKKTQIQGVSMVDGVACVDRDWIVGIDD